MNTYQRAGDSRYRNYETRSRGSRSFAKSKIPNSGVICKLNEARIAVKRRIEAYIRSVFSVIEKRRSRGRFSDAETITLEITGLSRNQIFPNSKKFQIVVLRESSLQIRYPLNWQSIRAIVKELRSKRYWKVTSGFAFHLASSLTRSIKHSPYSSGLLFPLSRNSFCLRVSA